MGDRKLLWIYFLKNSIFLWVFFGQDLVKSGLFFKIGGGCVRANIGGVKVVLGVIRV